MPVVVCTAASPLRQAEIGAWAPVLNKPFDLSEIERFLQAAAQRRGLEVRIGRPGSLSACARSS